MRMTNFSRPMLQVITMAVIAVVLAIPSAAHAFWRGGVFIGFAPFVVGPPVYYGPPIYYPPPVVYQPAQPPGRSCYAGAYVCPLALPGPVGGPCSCPADRGNWAAGSIG